MMDPQELKSIQKTVTDAVLGTDEVDEYQHLAHSCQMKPGMSGLPVMTMCGTVTERWLSSWLQPQCPDCRSTIGEIAACPACGESSLVNPVN